jgi:Alpha-glutamyl/putrescinyl thymine pyrophosphorylase clade 3
MRVHREGRAADDGYRSELVPGLRASADALRLAEEIAFSSGRLLALGASPPGPYGEARTLAGADLERATWICFLIVYLSPLEDEDPFAGIRQALTDSPAHVPDLDAVPLGPRSSHDPRRGGETLLAYAQWAARGGKAAAASAATADDGSQASAFTGDPAWTPARRFERVFERLALPGFARMGRYDLLVTLGRLGLYELQADSLHLSGARGLSAEDPTTLAAKRVFGIGDSLLLERRAATLAQAASVPVEALDLALANWHSPQPATLGFPREVTDEGAFERAGEALGL